jgi:hypothetical protein
VSQPQIEKPRDAGAGLFYRNCADIELVGAAYEKAGDFHIRNDSDGFGHMDYVLSARRKVWGRRIAQMLRDAFRHFEIAANSQLAAEQGIVRSQLAHCNLV